MLKAVLFDLDDTLANTSSLEEIRETRNYDELTPEVLAKIRPYKKVLALLEGLKAAGVKTGVVTNSGRRYAQAVLAQLGLPEFDTVVTYTDVKADGAKPSPDGILLALSNMGVKVSSDVIYIGDNYIDFVAAYRAGVKPVACSWASRRPISQVPALELSTEYLLSELDNAQGLLPAAEICEVNQGLDFDKKRLYFIPLDLDGNTITVKSDLRVLCLGRYFSQKSVVTARYHDAHPLSRKIAEKESNAHFEAPQHWIDLVAHCVKEIPNYFSLEGSLDLVTVIPSKPEKNPRLERMLSAVAEQLSSPPVAMANLFSFAANTPSQKSLARFEREDSIKNNLFLNPEHQGLVRGKTIVVIDDVLTTGATMRRAFDLLENEGANLVIGLALAKTVSIVEEEKECQKCGRPMRLRLNSANGIRFWGCTGYHSSSCDYNEPVEEKRCPKCDRSMVKRMNRQRRTYFLGCTGYNQSPACHHSENI
ncbi:hypothetical protein BVL52_10150 [Pseudomonas oryzihabitans]|uniref:phosphoglycolate phosphatase n=2 Tax=Pseudomonas oryzihabitans TaxID=47885 RepID=A0ABX3IVA7_9PSED|nr:hypothetical protein BVL52_10150 [Pseudomonas psychrotolerans]